MNETSSRVKPQYPNLDNVSFLILHNQFFYCVEDGRPTHQILWLDAYRLPHYDERFFLADCHLVVNWRRITKIDLKNYLIYIYDTPVWFDFIEFDLFKKLMKNCHVDMDKESRVYTYTPIPVDTPLPFCSFVKNLWGRLCRKT